MKRASVDKSADRASTLLDEVKDRVSDVMMSQGPE